MRRAPCLPPRWFARPRLALGAAAAAALLIGVQGEREGGRAAGQAGTLVVAQATDPDPARREQAGADALAAARAGPEGASARLVPPDDLQDWLRQAGVPPEGRALAAPTTITVRLARAADQARVAARLRAVPGIAVDMPAATGAPVRMPWALDGAALAALLALAAAAELRPLRSAMQVLHQLGATPAQRLALLLLAAGASGGAGALAGGMAASLARWPAASFAAFGQAVLATTALLAAALVPALRVHPAARP